MVKDFKTFKDLRFYYKVDKPIEPPPGLKNIYKQLENEIEDFVKPSHGELTEWAKQG